MKLCLACYYDRLASLFENANQYRLFAVQEGEARPAGVVEADQARIEDKISALLAHGVDSVICGGVCRRNLFLMTEAGMQVIPWICGEADKVIIAFKENRLAELTMPGCRGQGQGGRGRRCARLSPSGGGRRGRFNQK